MKRPVLLAFLFLFVIFPCLCVVPFSLLVSLPAGNPLREATITLFWVGSCVGLPLLMVVFVVLMAVDHVRSRRSARRLAAELGWKPLVENSNPLKEWHGGIYRGYPVAMKPIVTVRRSYKEGGGSHFTAVFYLRLVLGIPLPSDQEARSLLVYRPLNERMPAIADKEGNTAVDFPTAFPGLENDSRLTSRDQQKLLTFVQKGYFTGLRGGSYRSQPGLRNLYLGNRARVPETILPADVLPDVGYVLVHDQPTPSVLTLDELKTLLDDLTTAVPTF